MIYYKSKRPVDGKPPTWVIVDEDGEIINRNPSKDELKGLENEEYKRPFKSKIKNYTDEELLNELRRFEKEEGRIPTYDDFIVNVGYPSSKTYQRRFGSWSNVLKLVGLDVEPIVKKGILETNDQKARFAEMIVRDQYSIKRIEGEYK